MKKAFLLIPLFLLFLTVDAQKITVKSGDLSFLKGVTELNVDYDYGNMAVGKFKTEADYIEKKKNEYKDKSQMNGSLFHSKKEPEPRCIQMK